MADSGMTVIVRQLCREYAELLYSQFVEGKRCYSYTWIDAILPRNEICELGRSIVIALLSEEKVLT
jgi:hypothetical protein